MLLIYWWSTNINSGDVRWLKKWGTVWIQSCWSKTSSIINDQLQSEKDTSQQCASVRSKFCLKSFCQQNVTEGMREDGEWKRMMRGKWGHLWDKYRSLKRQKNKKYEKQRYKERTRKDTFHLFQLGPRCECSFDPGLKGKMIMKMMIMTIIIYISKKGILLVVDYCPHANYLWTKSWGKLLCFRQKEERSWHLTHRMNVPTGNCCGSVALTGIIKTSNKSHHKLHSAAVLELLTASHNLPQQMQFAVLQCCILLCTLSTLHTCL